MKLTIIIAVVCTAIQAREMYTTKWDNIDVDEILRSERLLQNYFKCLMEQGNCTPEGSELKRNLPDALKTECSKCSDRQKENTDKIVKFLIEQKPEMWGPLERKYDPEHIYYDKNYFQDAKEQSEVTTTKQNE